MHALKIDTNKKMPAPRKYTRYPWAEMKVGDSFYSTNTGETLGTSARTWCLRNKKKWRFTVRKERKGFRVWRVK